MKMPDFLTSILSISPKLEKGLMFYPNLNGMNFYGDSYIYDNLDKSKVRDFEINSQDLKHCKLTKSFLELGLDDGGLYDLDILTMVSHLMGIQSDELENTFTDIYCSFMYEVCDIDSSELDDKIPSIANQCYDMLK